MVEPRHLAIRSQQLAVCIGILLAVGAGATAAPQGRAAKAGWAPAVKPKPLSQSVQRGLAWLVEHQAKSGGWSQGEESAHMGASDRNVRDVPNVADTCAAALALIRAGSTPARGPHTDNVRRAIAYVCGEVERADEKPLYVTSMRGTRLQAKLGPFIDTFMASLLLAEARSRMPDPKSEKRVRAALETVMDKIERHQKPDGTWSDEGWAPVLAQSMAAKAINRAAQSGAPVKESVRQRAATYSRKQYDAKAGGGRGGFAGAGSAGVELYSSAGNLGAMQDSVNTDAAAERKARAQLSGPASPKVRAEARATLKRVETARKDLKSAQQSVARRLEDERFVSGFGSNGGEEFLSYMNIGESLVVQGGAAWEKWDRSMTQNMNRIQNKDGSWTGHHCITGRTFCTSAALMVLLVDRAPVPLAAKIGKR